MATPMVIGSAYEHAVQAENEIARWSADCGVAFSNGSEKKNGGDGSGVAPSDSFGVGVVTSFSIAWRGDAKSFFSIDDAKDSFSTDDAKNFFWIGGQNDFSSADGVKNSWSACVGGDLENGNDENANRNASLIFLFDDVSPSDCGCERDGGYPGV
jgi:hypothetical protein